MRRLAAKRLTGSDLTFFEWHFRHADAGGNQKAINLNADPFVDHLYPALPELAEARGGRIPLDLSIFGPGAAGLHNLQRKIIKHGTYKNWRLNGEFVNDPPEEPDRYSMLRPGDIALFEFFGVPLPISAKLLLVSATASVDGEVHRALSMYLGNRSMMTVDVAELDAIVSALPDIHRHPIEEFVLEADLEDAAHGGIGGVQRLSRKGRPVDRDELRRAKRRAEEVGRLGEELLDGYFAAAMQDGELRTYTWVSNENAISPFDFFVELIDGTSFRLDAKSTSGEFQRVLHISLAELAEMERSLERYALYRLYDVSHLGAKMRICKDVRKFAAGVLKSLNLPKGVTVDSVSVDPRELDFGSPVQIPAPSPNDDPV